MLAEHANRLRHRAGSAGGHYESYFVRANHPTRRLAFWVRHTIFSPRGRPQDALGELWAIVFDGERGRHVAVKQEWPLALCRFDDQTLRITLPGAALDAHAAQGHCASGSHRIDWDLRYAGAAPALLLLPPSLYDGSFPKAKSLVSQPSVHFSGHLRIDGETLEVERWPGSQNHNWGRQHTDRYAWGQVAGFDGHEDSFLEAASAKLRVGPWWTPWITPLVLRHRGREHRLNALWRSLRARASLQGFEWRFDSADDVLRVQGQMSARAADFVGLRYANPPGGIKHCLNSKIAHCELQLDYADGGARETLVSDRCAFEILTDPSDHGVVLAC